MSRYRVTTTMPVTCVCEVEDNVFDISPLAHCRFLELNQTLTNECLRLRRENEKCRRKTLKRWWLRTSRQHEDTKLLHIDDWHALNMRSKVPRTRKHLRDELDAERARNPELLRFLRWQETFCPFVDRARADDIDIAACFAPSQKIDFSGIEELAVKGKP